MRYARHHCFDYQSQKLREQRHFMMQCYQVFNGNAEAHRINLNYMLRRSVEYYPCRMAEDYQDHTGRRFKLTSIVTRRRYMRRPHYRYEWRWIFIPIQKNKRPRIN